MKYVFEKNTSNCNVTYHRTRTGPNHFIVFYKDTACIRFTPKDVGRCFGVAKFTPWVNEMREWCYTMINQYGSSLDKDNDDYKNYVLKHGFGPEVNGEPEPNDNTKMIT